MRNKNQTALTASAGLGLKKKIGLAVGVALLGLSQQALAHIEYYDLNAGFQVGDLTAAGKAASTAEYGPTSAAVTALNPNIVSTVDLPLSDPAQWNATYQSYPGNGTFTGVTYTPSASAATVDVYDVTGAGWLKGTQATLGDTHAVDWFNFRLSQPSTVTISWGVNRTDTGAFINSAFTLYKGFLSYQSHDASLDELNPDNGIDLIQNPLDTGSVVDTQGIVSPFRDTVNNAAPYVGQFNALNGFSQANAAGNWAAIEFITAVNALTANSGANLAAVKETLTISLAPGNYSIGASGAATGLNGNTTGAHGVLSFSATAAPVPLPGAAWLFLTAMMGVLGLNRRKHSVAA